jgi:hypothetical protein
MNDFAFVPFADFELGFKISFKAFFELDLKSEMAHFQYRSPLSARPYFPTFNGFFDETR